LNPTDYRPNHLSTIALQVEQVRVNKAKARSMKSRVDALMRFMTVRAAVDC
jgi:hypothetical protein